MTTCDAYTPARNAAVTGSAGNGAWFLLDAGPTCGLLVSKDAPNAYDRSGDIAGAKLGAVATVVGVVPCRFPLQPHPILAAL